MARIKREYQMKWKETAKELPKPSKRKWVIVLCLFNNEWLCYISRTAYFLEHKEYYPFWIYTPKPSKKMESKKWLKKYAKLAKRK